MDLVNTVKAMKDQIQFVFFQMVMYIIDIGTVPRYKLKLELDICRCLYT